jgi:DNA-directed RNA polymerase sigma subunit (sigma70/sigma32)
VFPALTSPYDVLPHQQRELVSGGHGGRARRNAEVAAPADAVRAYLRQMGRVALLSAAEEVELAKRIEAGVLAGERLGEMAEADHTADPQMRRDLCWIARDGQRVKKHLLEANLRLVVSIARTTNSVPSPAFCLPAAGALL